MTNPKECHTSDTKFSLVELPWSFSDGPKKITWESSICRNEDDTGRINTFPIVSVGPSSPSSYSDGHNYPVTVSVSHLRLPPPSMTTSVETFYGRRF